VPLQKIAVLVPSSVMAAQSQTRGALINTVRSTASPQLTEAITRLRAFIAVCDGMDFSRFSA